MTSKRRLTHDRLEALRSDPDVSVPEWVDSHSVTCALCGDLADERETISLWADDYDGSTPLHKYIPSMPDGEAHPSCFENRLAELRAMGSSEDYHVTIDLRVESMAEHRVFDVYEIPIYVESIGPHQYQVGLDVTAPNPGEAYRRGVDFAVARLALVDAMDTQVLGATVHGPDEEVTFD